MRQPKLIGPPKAAANQYVFDRLKSNCMECECCGEQWHYKGQKDVGFCVQVNVAGRIMAVRRAMYMAAFPKKAIVRGRRVTSTCPNEYCINPKLLIQATASVLLKSHYDKGVRDRRRAAAHLAKCKPAQKLTPDDALQIMQDERSAPKVAADLGVSPAYVRAIRRGQSQARANPFAGLIR